MMNVITGFGPDCGQILTSDPLVSRIAFTGGPTGRRVIRNAASHLLDVALDTEGTQMASSG